MAHRDLLALFSLTVYDESDQNRINPPPGWVRNDLLSVVTDNIGFAADVFQGPNNEIVVAFRGTDDFKFSTDLDWAN
jgi:hypothetical protein